MALKRKVHENQSTHGFGSIRNNMALKLMSCWGISEARFGSIRNNMALKLIAESLLVAVSFGSIRNNMALKPRRT